MIYDVEILGDRMEAEMEMMNEVTPYHFPTDEMMEARQRVISLIESGKFQVYNICDVMDWIYSTFGVKPLQMDYGWETDRLIEFCNNFDLYLYEKPREEFFEWEGIQQAQRAGRRGVILSDLS